MNKKRIVSSVLAVCLVASSGTSLVACGPQIEEYDKTKTQLFVQIPDCGFGSDWGYSLKAAFEDKYKDVSFSNDENGDPKYGVEVVISVVKDQVKPDMVAFSDTEVYFGENMSYSMLKEVALNITDIVTTPNAEDENKTIKSKMTSEQIAYLELFDEQYYAIPFSEYYTSSFIYDIDTFNAKKLYFAKDRDNGNNGFVASLTEERTVGPDGKKGTNDDGLPSSYEEWFLLCEQMVQVGVIPFVWAGAEALGYTSRAVDVLAMTFEGVEYANHWDFDGTSKIVRGFEETDTVLTDKVKFKKAITEDVAITPQNGYELSQSEGRYYAQQFFYQIIKNNYFDPRCYSEVFTWLNAQEEFIYSNLEGKPIGILIDGNYWQTEAADAFDRSVEDYGEIAENRNFGLIQAPRKLMGTVEEGEAVENVQMDVSRSFMFINNAAVERTGKQALAKLFLQFANTEAMLADYTRTTTAGRALSYEISDEIYEDLDTTGKQVWDMKKGATFLYGVSTCPLTVNNTKFISGEAWRDSVVNGSAYQFSVSAYKKGYTAYDYFLGQKQTEQSWTNAYGDLLQ